MTIERLTTLHKAQPFLPFRIHLSNGRFLDVPHPDFLARSPAGRTVVLYKADETFEIIDLFLVAGLELLKPKDRKGNGQERKQS